MARFKRKSRGRRSFSSGGKKGFFARFKWWIIGIGAVVGLVVFNKVRKNLAARKTASEA